MHGTIFQLSTTPIEKKYYAKRSEFRKSGFIPFIADSVVKEYGRKKAIGHLEALFKWGGAVFDPSEESFYFPEGFKEKFFKGRFEDSKKMMAELTLAEFSHGYGNFYRIRDNMNLQFGCYVFTEDKQCVTLDEFLRRELKEGTKCYVGEIFDYHF